MKKSNVDSSFGELSDSPSEKKEIYTTVDDHKKIIRAKLTGDKFPKEVEGKMENPMYTQSEEVFITSEVEKELASDGYKKNASGLWAKEESASRVESPSEEKEIYTTAEDHKKIIRAKLTGGEFPKEVEGKRESPMFTQSEEDFLTRGVEKELASDGYKKNASGLWAKKD